MCSCQGSDTPPLAAATTVLLNDSEGTPISSEDEGRRPSWVGLAAWLTVAGSAYAVALVMVFRLFVQTRRGQYVDAVALTGNTIGQFRIAGLVQDVLNVISYASIAGAIVVIGFIALARRRILLAIAAVMLVAGANLTTQLLKYEVFLRPDLEVDDPVRRAVNTLPSGHTTVAASVAIALVLVLPPAIRGTTALFGAAYAGITGVATLSASWHRPSDVIAAFLVVGVWSAIAALLLVLGQPDRAQPTAEDAHPVALTLLILAAVGLLAVWVLALYVTDQALPAPIPTLSTTRLFVAYAGSAAGICGVISAVMAVTLATMHWVVPRYAERKSEPVPPKGLAS